MYLGGACFLFTGLGLLVNEAATGVYDDATTEKALALIGAGFSVIGRAGKADKQLAATKEQR